MKPCVTPVAAGHPPRLPIESGQGDVGLVGLMPKAIAIMAGSRLGPEVLSAARRAFDNAWAEIAGKYIDAAECTTNAGDDDIVRGDERKLRRRDGGRSPSRRGLAAET
jgi:hypothetical protein